MRTLRGHTAPVRGIAFNPNGRLLASASEDNTIRIWSPSTGEQLRILSGHTDKINGIAFSPDGLWLASASDDKTVRLWDPATGKLLRTFVGHNSHVLSVAFSPDGKLLASGGAAQVDLSRPDGTGQLRLWNPSIGKEEHVFDAVTGDVRSLAFSPNNKELCNSIGFADHTEITSWDLQTRTVLGNWNAQRGSVNTLAYSPDGHWLAYGGDDGRIRLVVPLFES
jgi:WD40 repeat protein